ncbi:uncharacterized protein N7459_004514 [Penicillium hispanicum]|uniref:uncharacterized protein n=1 Tax=Penicillium hispanicum TaxID=1080232 RepID=UPI0025410990|nr:uncharacterized protein N7459_004514 [Penicillium hispanicum]KAJ5584714.1 hypothetical protein N7459_004514 [Penicillium hispanicum]
MAMNPQSRLCLWFFLVVFLAGCLFGVKSQETVVVTLQTTVEASKTVYATPTIPSPASYTSLHDFKDTVLAVTNEYRKAHDADPLTWNGTLAEYSHKWASACLWKHSGGPYGENLAFGYPNSSAAVAAWGNEEEHYNFKKPTGFTEKTGHFTQLVWRSTTEVGCAAVNCGYTEDNNKVRRESDESNADSRLSPRADGSTRAQGWYVVCEYTPAGNVVGQSNKYFKLNVLPANTSQATASTTASTSQPSGGATVGHRADFTVRMMLLALGTVGLGMSLYT